MKDLSKVTRLEVIGEGREYVNHNIKWIAVQLQDDGRTLKIFIN